VNIGLVDWDEEEREDLVDLNEEYLGFLVEFWTLRSARLWGNEGRVFLAIAFDVQHNSGR
jgi:hypothetical protein